MKRMPGLPHSQCASLQCAAFALSVTVLSYFTYGTRRLSSCMHSTRFGDGAKSFLRIQALQLVATLFLCTVSAGSAHAQHEQPSTGSHGAQAADVWGKPSEVASAPPEIGSTVERKGEKASPISLDPRLPNVLLIGDSISMGYLPSVREQLKGKANVTRPVSVKNLPVNCEGTTSGVANLYQWLGTNRWAVIHFNFGLHDLKWVKKPGDVFISTDPSDPKQADVVTYETNLEKIVDRLEQTGAKLIFATTTPVPADITPGRTSTDVPKYNAAALRVMKAHNIPVNDLYGFCLPRLGQLQKKKNVHFTDAGSKELGLEVARAIEGQLAK
jgi:lysophospholipase L1-like esterase